METAYLYFKQRRTKIPIVAELGSQFRYTNPSGKYMVAIFAAKITDEKTRVATRIIILLFKVQFKKKLYWIIRLSNIIICIILAKIKF